MLAAFAAFGPRGARAEEHYPSVPVTDASTSTTTGAKAPATRWGEAELGVLGRFGRLGIPAGGLGKSGAIQGSGWLVKYVMPVGWGGYWRWSNYSTTNNDHYDWYQRQYVFGFLRRIHQTGRAGWWSVRTQSHLAIGMMYWQMGTNESCARSFAPLGTTCQTLGAQQNASGSGIGMEVRVGGEVGAGPIALGVDVGVEGYRRWSTGSNSDSPPGWSYAPTVQLNLGITLPIE